MIKKLKVRIFLILMLSISAIVVGTITIFAIINYNNTLNIASSSIDRFIKIPDKPDKDILDFSREDLKTNNSNMNNSNNVELNKKNYNTDNVRENSNIDMSNTDNLNIDVSNTENYNIDYSNIYYYIVEKDNGVISLSHTNSETENYALKVAKKNKQTGTIGNYIFKTRKTKDGNIIVYLMEDENAINRLKTIYFLAIGASLISIIIIYIISKLVSNVIVKPVEETMEKQKQFISDASHELKTPLAVIEANVDVLESQIGENKWMKYIQSEITSIDKLINDLLYLTKLENTKNIKTNEVFNLSEEVNLVSSMFESLAYEKNVSINYDIVENIRMNANKEEVKQVLSVLLDNAIKHTKESGKVIIELKTEKNNVIVKVKNEGEPIPEEEKDKIFERFYRIDKSRNRNEKRYGLGLAIVKSIIEGYNGKIEVFCMEGITTFKVIMPQK